MSYSIKVLVEECRQTQSVDANFLTFIYNRVVARKIRLTRRFCLLNKINKRIKYLSGWRGIVYSVTSGCFDLIGRCYQATLSGRLVIDLGLAYLCVPDFKHRLQKMLFVKKIWLIEKNFFSIHY